MKSPQHGFIALMSAIIISAILLITVATGSLTGFYSRSNVLDSELKGRSAAAADACADQAFLLIVNDPANNPPLTTLIFNSLDSCQVIVTDAGSDKSVRIQATSSNAVTNLQISYDPDTEPPSIISWQEVPVF